MSGLDDVARLFLAAANCARGAFDLAERVAARFADKLLEVALLRSLLKQMTPSSMPHVSQLLDQLPAADGYTLVTERTTCVCCGGSLVPALERSDPDRPHGPRKAGQDVPLFTSRGVVTAKLYFKSCQSCKASHGLSFASGGTVLEQGEPAPDLHSTHICMRLPP